MKASELKRKYIEFFKKKNHKEIPNASLIPENDPTVLFTTAGMHPLVPYLLGQKHPQGKRLVNVQGCLRTGDINEVGDKDHLTFFEMLGNWSLGDYWKKEAIEYSFEFLIKVLKLPKEKLAVSVFKGDKDAPKDQESAEAWLSLGVSQNRITFLGKKDNWWGPAGNTGPCGPCTEIFYWNSKKPAPKKFNNNDKTWVEIGNNVFMEYNKTSSGKYEPLNQKNVDFGGGVERIAMVLQSKKTVFETESFSPIVTKIKKISKPKESQLKSVRIILDHLRSSVFLLSDGIVPSNLDQGYVLRRLIRTAIRHARLLGIQDYLTEQIANEVIKIYEKDYPLLKKKSKIINEELKKEEEKFKKTLNLGLRQFEKLIKNKKITGSEAFTLFSTYGFPLEMTEDLAKEYKIKINKKEFEKEFKKHQELSRTATKGRFSSGLADQSTETKKLHTATHLLHTALRKVLGINLQQKGSNITSERLRFDFSFDRKLTEQEIKKVENLVNKKIQEAVPIKKEEMSPKEAKKQGALGFFEHKYGEKVTVYTIEGFSKEICTGPHVNNTKEIGKLKIIKEESVASGIRRIKAKIGT
ncbi:MAG: alanine--tRNA ligase [Candidatus Woesearchaeota archaeon]